jgi:hypothetical protein
MTADERIDFGFAGAEGHFTHAWMGVVDPAIRFSSVMHSLDVRAWRQSPGE